MIKQYRLVRNNTGEIVKTGDVLHDFRGDRVTVAGWDGRRVHLKYGNRNAVEYFPSVIACRIEAVTEGSPATVGELPPKMTPAELWAACYALAVACRDRMTNLQLGTGKRRDDAAIHYLRGAAQLAHSIGRGELYDFLQGPLFAMQVRGFRVIQDIIDRGPAATLPVE